MTVARALLLSAVLLPFIAHCGNAATLQGGVEQNQVTTGGGAESEPYQVDGQCWAACNAAADWQKASLSADQRTRSSTCLSYLDSAHSYEEQISSLQQQSVTAGKGRNFSQRDELSRQAHELVTPRDQQIAAFAECTKVALATTQGNQSPADSAYGAPPSQDEQANPEPPLGAGPAYADSPYGPLQTSTSASGDQPAPAPSPTLLYGHADLPRTTGQPTYPDPVAVHGSTGGTASNPVRGGVSSAGGFKKADFYPDGIHVHLQIQNDDPPNKEFDREPLERTEKEKTGRYFTTFSGVLRRNHFGRGEDAIEVTTLEDNFGHQIEFHKFEHLK
jgi:hypothetical protein